MKQFKPVPDVECLKYHGTPETPDIKIFVSRRIDADTETIDNPLYIPVRCGAVFDPRENIETPGDDTGENISEKVNAYGDLTVQYWAWKNVEADYFGFCSPEHFIMADGEAAPSQNPSDRIAADTIRQWDVISERSADTEQNLTVRDSLLRDIYHFDPETLRIIVRIFKKEFPEYSSCANQYLNSFSIQRNPVWIARKDIAVSYLAFQFSFLEKLEDALDLRYAGKERKQIYSCLAAHLWRIFLIRLKDDGLKILESNTSRFFGKRTTAVLPAYDGDSTTIVFSSSNTFAPYLCVALKSMLNHISAGNNYDILVLEKNIDEIDKEKMLNTCSGHSNVSLRFINVSRYISGVSFYVPTQDLSEETYYTVLVPWVLENYKKALVMDCDIIINADLSNLFHTDLAGNIIAAVKELVYLGFLNNPVINVNNNVTDYTINKLGLEDPYNYFNAGVLLMDLEAFRRDFTLAQLLGEITKNQFRIVEQDLLNSICYGRVLFLDYSWNFLSCLTEPYMLEENVMPSDTTIPNIRLAPEKELASYHKASKNPFIYHYLTKYKPWYYPFLQYADIWWEVARTTVYYELFLYRMSRNAYAVTAAVAEKNSSVFSLLRKIVDKLFPKGSRRREYLKKPIPESIRKRFR